MQLLLLCGDIETNPGPTTKVCPECSCHFTLKSLCLCGYSFKSAKNVTTVCPKCSSLNSYKEINLFLVTHLKQVTAMIAVLGHLQ